MKKNLSKKLQFFTEIIFKLKVKTQIISVFPLVRNLDQINYNFYNKFYFCKTSLRIHVTF